VTGLGIAQITTTPGAVAANGELIQRAVEALTAQGTRLVILPELVASGYTLDGKILAAVGEPVPGPTTEAWCMLAAASGSIVVGGLCERDGDRLFNAVVAVGADGVLLHYRKLHLFAAEKQVFSPGNLGLPIVDTPSGRIGACVCYDLRFPEVVRLLALRGAEIVCVPSAWVGGFDTRADTRTHGCPQSDGAQLQANLNQVFIAAASQAGTTEAFTFLGSSLVVDPTGAALVGPRSRTEQWTGVCDVAPDAVSAAQDRGGGVHPRADRRTDVYSIRYEGDQW
jgi:N-carbamoylputrescine amidase